MSRLLRSITEIIGFLNRGKFRDRLDEELAEAITTLENQKSEKGVATLSITLKLKYQNGRLDIEPAFKSKLPEDTVFGDTPFWTQDGALSAQHPQQTDLEDWGKPDRARTSA